MNEAIQLAIEKGGYITPLKKLGLEATTLEPIYPQIIIDPLFWQALGKALGWKIYTCSRHAVYPTDDKNQKWCLCTDPDTEWAKSPDWKLSWQYYAHQYFELALTGGDKEKFWKDLLNV